MYLEGRDRSDHKVAVIRAFDRSTTTTDHFSAQFASRRDVKTLEKLVAFWCGTRSFRIHTTWSLP